MTNNSLRGAIECEFGGEKHALKFTQESFLWLEEVHQLGLDKIKEFLAAAEVPWKYVGTFIAAGLLHEGGAIDADAAREMVKGCSPADLQADIFSGLIFALNGVSEEKKARLREAFNLLKQFEEDDTGKVQSDSPSTAV